MKMSDIPTKYEVLTEQYLRSILDITHEVFGTAMDNEQVQDKRSLIIIDYFY